MTEAGIILPMKTTRGEVKDGKVRLFQPLPEGEIVYVRLLTVAEKLEDEEVMEELMEEMRPFQGLSEEAFLAFEKQLQEEVK